MSSTFYAMLSKKIYEKNDYIKHNQPDEKNNSIEEPNKNLVSDLGKFIIESGAIIISDPCYDRPQKKSSDTMKLLDLNYELSNIKNGQWNGYIEIDQYSKRPCVLVAIHEDYLTMSNWQSTNLRIGVDSGQAGIYDAKFFKDDNDVGTYPVWSESSIKDVGDKWYYMNCHATLGAMADPNLDMKNYHRQNDITAGIIPHGVVSSSGWGDGIYDVDLMHESTTIVGVRVIFIINQYDSEEDD